MCRIIQKLKNTLIKHVLKCIYQNISNYKIEFDFKFDTNYKLSK